MKFFVTIYERGLTGDPTTPAGVEIKPLRWSMDVVGGPAAAAMTARGPWPAIGELMQRLRCPIEIHDETGRLMWWGYVHQVTAAVNGFEFGATLDTMSNRVAMAYSLVEPGSATVGVRATTDWTQDDDSVAEYGIKELLASLDGATAAQADLVRDLILAQYRYPIATWQPAMLEDGVAQIECRGWWETLGWRLYANSGISSVETTTQIATAIDDTGQFFGAITIETASGINSSEYQDGDSTLRTIVEDLLARGTAGGGRLRATVDAARDIVIAAEPAAGAADYHWLKDGSIYDERGLRVAARTCPYGVWVARPDVGNIDLTQLISPAQTFVTRAEYSAADDTWQPQARGVPGPFDIAEVVRR